MAKAEGDITDKFFTLQNAIQSTEPISAEDVVFSLLEAFSRTIYQSFYIIDYHKKSFEYVSDKPMLFCGHSANEVMEMGYEFYAKYVEEEDLNLLLKINQIGFDFYDQIPIDERKLYSISYDFQLKGENRCLIHHKLTPFLLNSEGKLHKAFCIISLSDKQNSGNIKITKNGLNYFWRYDLKDNYWYKLKDNYWYKDEILPLKPRECEILQLSAQGMNIDQVAGNLSISTDTVKYHRRKLFEKLEVSNITEALSVAINNHMI